MKALLLDQFSDPGGAQQGLLDLLPGLRDLGWQALVGLPGDGELFDRARELGFPAERIECGPYASGRKTVGDVARFVTGTPKLARQIRALADGADVVYVNGPRLLPAAAMARLRVPVVFHSHSYLAPGAIRSLAGRALLHMQARVIANCEFVAAPWRKYAETQIIYNGVAGSAATADRRGNVLACIGRIAPEKGQLAFLDAARLVDRAIPGCRFVIYGAPLFGDAGAERYDAEARSLAAGLPVEFAGWVADVYAALARVDLLLVPSRPIEATTRVILEAYAAGTPVIAFGSGGIREIVDQGRSGFLVASPEEMAQAAIGLIRDPGRRASMSKAARDSWQSRFTLDRYRAEVAAALETAARRLPPASRQQSTTDHTRNG
jgi:glycosyltransferase involved in cell wall biosynthesis